MAVRLHFNADKCKVTHIGGNKNSNRHYMMKSVGLQNTTEEKDLGVWIINDLKASFHVAQEAQLMLTTGSTRLAVGFER